MSRQAKHRRRAWKCVSLLNQATSVVNNNVNRNGSGTQWRKMSADSQENRLIWTKRATRVCKMLLKFMILRYTTVVTRTMIMKRFYHQLLKNPIISNIKRRQGSVLLAKQGLTAWETVEAAHIEDKTLQKCQKKGCRTKATHFTTLC